MDRAPRTAEFQRPFDGHVAFSFQFGRQNPRAFARDSAVPKERRSFRTELTAVIEQHDVVIEIGSIPVRIRTADPVFRQFCRILWPDFSVIQAKQSTNSDIDLPPPDAVGAEEDVRLH